MVMMQMYREILGGKDFSHLDNHSMTVIDIPGLHPPT